MAAMAAMAAIALAAIAVGNNNGNSSGSGSSGGGGGGCGGGCNDKDTGGYSNGGGHRQLSTKSRIAVIALVVIAAGCYMFRVLWYIFRVLTYQSHVTA